MGADGHSGAAARGPGERHRAVVLNRGAVRAVDLPPAQHLFVRAVVDGLQLADVEYVGAGQRQVGGLGPADAALELPDRPSGRVARQDLRTTGKVAAGQTDHPADVDARGELVEGRAHFRLATEQDGFVQVAPSHPVGVRRDGRDQLVQQFQMPGHRFELRRPEGQYIDPERYRCRADRGVVRAHPKGGGQLRGQLRRPVDDGQHPSQCLFGRGDVGHGPALPGAAISHTDRPRQG